MNRVTKTIAPPLTTHPPTHTHTQHTHTHTYTKGWPLKSPGTSYQEHSPNWEMLSKSWLLTVHNDILLMTLVLVLILNPLLDFFFLYIKLMCPYFILLIYTDGERDGLWMACPFRTLVVLYRMFPFIICLILMNYLMEFYFIGFVNAHLPGCFCPWTFRLNIGLNTSPSDSFVSYLNSHLGYSAGEFQALQLIVLAVFGAVD